MAWTELTVAAPDGPCVVSLHTPAGVETHPGVVLYPDAGGARETFRVMGDHLAGLGLLTQQADRIRVTASGRMVLNAIIRDLATD